MPLIPLLLNIRSRLRRRLTVMLGSVSFYIILSLILHLAAYLAANRAVFGPADTGLDQVKQNSVIVNILGGGRKKPPAPASGTNDAAASRKVETFSVMALQKIVEAPPAVTNAATNSAPSNAAALATADTNAVSMSDITFSTNTNGFVPFELGETIIYDVEVSIAEMPAVTGTVGTVVITLEDIAMMNGRRVFVGRAETHSLELISDLYQLHDIFITWFDAATLRTYKIEKKVQEGQHFDYVTNLYFSDQGYGIYYHKFAPDGKRYEMQDVNSYDIISLLYLLRVVNREKPIDINWVADYGQQRRLLVSFSDAGEIEVAMKGKYRRVNAVAARDAKTGITIYLAKDYGSFPVKAVIPAFKVSGYTFTLNATLKKYIPGRKW